jgi:hypothetical protein
LDWTKSPLHALFFALSQEPEKDQPRAVWVLPPHELNKRTIGDDSVFCPGGLESRMILYSNEDRSFNLDEYLPEALDPADHRMLPEKPVAIEAPLAHSRIRGQQGCFTVHGSLAASLETYFGDDDSPPTLVRIDIDSIGKREAFLEDLYHLGVNEESVYQDLDSLCARIVREQGKS